MEFKDEALPNLQRLKLGFNVHRGDQYTDMISGIEYLFNLKEIALEIGAAAGVKKTDRRAAEIAVRDAIQKHPRFHDFLNIESVDWIGKRKYLFTRLMTGTTGASTRRSRGRAATTRGVTSGGVPQMLREEDSGALPRRRPHHGDSVHGLAQPSQAALLSRRRRSRIPPDGLRGNGGMWARALQRNYR